MNYPLAREIYGHGPLMVDRPTFSTLFNLLHNLRIGDGAKPGDEKSNSSFLYHIQSNTRVVDDTYDLKSDTSDEMIYVINLNGPIIKNGGLSSWGMKDLIAEIKGFEADSRVIGGVMMVDSGGGSGLAMELMQYFLLNERQKPLVGLIERAGCACSAAAGIIDCCDWVMAESETSEIGSYGTMASFGGIPNGTTDSDGVKWVTMYATKSTMKNKWFEDAINNDDYKLLITQELDPFNERFLSLVKQRRPNATDDQLDGSVFEASTVLGSLVDEIGSFDRAIAKVKELNSISKLPTPGNGKTTANTKNKIQAMTAEEIRAQHPEAYNAIFAAGVQQATERVNVWLVHHATDPAAVVKGIQSGKDLDAVSREEFLLKATSGAKLKDIQNDSNKTVIVPEANGGDKEPTEVDSFYAEVDKSNKKGGKK